MANMRKIGSVQAILLMLIVLIIGGLVGGALVYLAATKSPESVQGPTKIVYPKDVNLPTFAPIVDVIRPAVVNVYTEQNVKVPFHSFRSPFDDFFGDDILRHFFGQPQGNYKMKSLGSGVLMDPAGFILTNNHVIDQADKINVKLSDGTEYNAEIVGRDAKTDLAVLKITAKGKLPAAVFGDSDSSKTGDWVLAIGNPLGYSETVSHGIISALGRHVGVAEYEDFIQTDAPINPGNSGGPLVNLKGEVIGINTVIASQTGNNIGIGFAIPSNLAKTVFTELKTHGKVVRGWLGVGLQDLSPELAQKFGVESGVRITRVFQDSPAEKAGIKVDDIIVLYDGKKVKNSDELRESVGSTKVGKNVQIQLVRNKVTITVKVTIAEMPGNISSGSLKENGIDLGLTVENVTPDIARKIHLGKTSGVLVTEIEPGSLAESAGVQTGDVILELNDQTIKNTSDFDSATSRLSKGEKIYLRIFRDGYIIYITFKSD